ncbi:MAG: GLPGLI family protein, partial [Candidatus Bacteroides intestinipullorum]|nr:GLPGLI family protein [Candidatus Bacteroides intestinipullorum]
HWTVWFTPDIPVSEGPWKLHGLPGLILQAEDSEHWFSFACIEIENAPYKELAVPEKKYVDCTRKEYEDLVKLMWEDPYAFSQKVAGFRGQGFGTDGRPLTYPERKALFLEK